jgi:hypothetical protein
VADVVLPFSLATLPACDIFLVFASVNIVVDVGIPVDIDIDITTVPI